MKWCQIIWELPQTLLGLIISCFLTILKKSNYLGRRIMIFKRNNWFSQLFSGTSLGFYILLPAGRDEVTVMHEYGHCLQSAKWGWLYPLVIGIPSLYNNLRGRKVYKNKTYEEVQKDYYNRYPEKEADELGGVVWVDGVREIASVDAR